MNTELKDKRKFKSSIKYKLGHNTRAPTLRTYRYRLDMLHRSKTDIEMNERSRIKTVLESDEMPTHLQSSVAIIEQ